MKSKKRHHDSSDESEDSDVSAKSSSSSDSESDDSSSSEHRYKKKRKRAESSESESNSDDQKRSKKRKHKKKKKKHTKKKRRSVSHDNGSVENISISEGEISTKKKRKHKHKHSKRAATSSDTEDERHGERRLHSVVKERRASSEDSPPNRTYYQKEYRRSVSAENYEREREVQRFYRGSSKEHRSQYQDSRSAGYGYDRERNERVPSHQDKYDNRGRYFQKPPYTSNESYGTRQRDYEEYKRFPRYDYEEYRRKQREEAYNSREDTRGNNKYNTYEDRAPKRREFPEGRDYRERRVPPEPERYHEKVYPVKRDKYQEEKYSPDRSRDVRRERQNRVERQPVVATRDSPKSRSPVPDRYRDKRRTEVKEERDSGKYRERERGDREERDREREDKGGRERPSDEHRERPEPERRERRTRFDNPDEKKEYSWGKTDVKKEGDKKDGEKEKPNFGLSGKLTADANTVNGVVIKYTEPDDAKQPKRRWRFYPFKGDKSLPILYIHRQSCFVIGRDKKVVDIPLEHPSISKQHAALQYRATPFTRADGSTGRRVRPYVIDLDSANGTFVNNKKISPRRYVELLERDVVKFGFSQREYVLLHENSKDDALDDDQDAPPVVTAEHIKQEKRAKAVAAADGE